MEELFSGMEPDELDRLIVRANLGRVNTQIARMRLIDQEHYADIGAAVGYDRSTVSKRMPGIVARMKSRM